MSPQELLAQTEIDLSVVLKNGAVVVLGILLWGILAIASSLFLKRSGPWKGLLNQLRFLFFPALIYYLAVWIFFAPERTSMASRIAETVLAAACAILGMGILNLIFTPPALKRWTGRDIPALLLDVVRYLIIIIAVAVILKVVWGEDVTPLIGALGIGGIVLGLALQETLSNFFNGLAMLAERPFSIGEWIRVGEGKEGQVEHITWRAVKIRTRDNEYIIYPNSMVAKDKVVNFNLPTRPVARHLSVGASYDDPPDLVKRTVLEVLAGVPGVLRDPPPVIFTIAYADFSINYDIKFFIDDFAACRAIEDQAMSRLWYAFRRQGIEIPFPIRTLYHHGAPGAEAPAGEEKAAAPHRRKVDVAGVLSRVPIFGELPRDLIEALARVAAVLEYGSGERVIAQGEPGSALYAIASGAARVAVRGEDGAEREVAVLQAGAVFGEMSLLTGDPRTASVYSLGNLVAVEVGKEVLSPLLEKNPALAAGMAELMVLRREGLDRTRAEGSLDAGKKVEVETAAKTLLGRIRTFFGLR